MNKLTKDLVVKSLEQVKAPASRASIVELNQISRLEVEENSVFVELQFQNLDSTIEKSLRFQVEKVLKQLQADASVVVEFRKISANTSEASAAQRSPKVGTMIAVGSGKGGVGKSSLTVNLALAFKALNYSVGILDCDVYGPSIPTMLKVEDKKPLMMNGKIQPIEAFGLKVMSAGFFVEPGQSIVWRGPMIHKLIQQFVHDVDWSGVDILIVDLPPGTGDAPLWLSQTMPLTGAVMVSTPQHISLIDVHKGVSMFNQVKVPILGIVENMSHFVCPSCDHSTEIFDRGGVKKFCAELSVGYLGDVPIESKIRQSADEGRPFMIDNENSFAGRSILQIARKLQPFVKTAEDREEEAIKLVL